MFRLYREELQRRRSIKPIQLVEEMLEALGFDDLVEPDTKVEMSTAFSEVLKCYACIFNPEGGGKQVYDFDAHRLFESMCRTWAELHATVATSSEKVWRDKALLDQKVENLTDGEDGQVKNLPVNWMPATKSFARSRLPWQSKARQ